MLARTNSNSQKTEFKAEENNFLENNRTAQLLKNRTIFISEAVTSDTARNIVSDLLILDEKEKKPIYLYLNSPGGEVNSGFSIYDTIRFIASEVTVITTGLCASIATIINIAVPKEKRLAMPNSSFLIHQPLIHGQVYGQATDIEITANEIIKTRSKLNKLLATECGQDLKKIEEDTQRDYWMSSEEAVSYGLISRVIKNKSDI